MLFRTQSTVTAALLALALGAGAHASQPLSVPGVAIPNQGTHNVVHVATMSDTLCAFDADNGTELWSVNFASGVGATAYQPHAVDTTTTIRSTPEVRKCVVEWSICDPGHGERLAIHGE